MTQGIEVRELLAAFSLGAGAFSSLAAVGGYLFRCCHSAPSLGADGGNPDSVKWQVLVGEGVVGLLRPGFGITGR